MAGPGRSTGSKRDRTIWRDAWVMQSAGFVANSWKYLGDRIRWSMPPKATYEALAELRRGPDKYGWPVERIHVSRRGSGAPVCGVQISLALKMRQAWGQEFEYFGPGTGPRIQSRFARCEECERLVPPVGP